jgi:nucleotide-binding universal stress UspA family protein
LQGLQVFRRLISDITPWRFFEKLDAQKSDIIVMGTRGYTGLLADTFIGTNAQRVIRYSPFPVLSIPEDVEFNGIKKVMIATDFKDDISTMVKGTIAFAKLFDAEVDVVMINTRNNYNTTQYAKDQFHKLAEQHPYHKMALFVHNAENVEEGIKEMVFSNNIDVISMLTHGRTGLQHLLVGSIAESVSSHIRCPLLTFRLQQD